METSARRSNEGRAQNAGLRAEVHPGGLGAARLRAL